MDAGVVTVHAMRHPLFSWALVPFALCAASACKGEPQAAVPAQPAAESPRDQAKATPAAGLMKCGDFLSTAEVVALGLDSKRYKEDETQPSAGLGLRCTLGKVGTVIFQRDKLTDASEDEKLAKAAGVSFKLLEGPPVGSETRWTQVATMYGVNFVSSNKHFTANVSCADRDLAHKVAQALDAKMSKL
jgi:hypothetical protein